MLPKVRTITSIIAIIAIIVEPTAGFSMSSSNRYNALSSRFECTQLNLHPDQASELVEAAATELLKSQAENDESEAPSSSVAPKSADDDDKDLIDDTNKHASNPLSAASSMSQPARFSVNVKWWSTTFSSIRRRGN